MTTEFMFGVCFLMYGLVKIALAIITLSLPDHIKEKIRLVFTNDTTLAGVAFDGVLIAYAIYSIIHGLNLLGYDVPNFTESIMFKSSFYILLGLFLIIFYSLVLFTQVPISKLQRQYQTYEILGLGGGVCFLITSMFIPYCGKWM